MKWREEEGDPVLTDRRRRPVVARLRLSRAVRAAA
jgi:hypothetical protein